MSALLTGTTPGPWRLTNAAYRYHSPDKHAAAYWIIEGGTGINGVSGLRINGYFGEANARLIAAAPDLALQLTIALARIAALEEILHVRDLNNHPSHNHHPATMDDRQRLDITARREEPR